MKLNISVTKQDIQEGQPNSCSLCPVARAVERAFIRKKLHPYLVSVGGMSGSVSFRTRKMRHAAFTLPKRVQQLIHAFDGKCGRDYRAKWAAIKPLRFAISI